MLKTYYEEENVMVCWDYNNSWISVDWRNVPSQQTVISGCEEMFELLILKQASLIQNDNSKITGTWVRASKWVAEDWFPRMITAGLEKFAWIESRSSTLSVISAKRAAQKNKSGVIKLFKEATEAELWLRS